MARETVHSPSPVSDFFNDAKPWCEGGVAFVHNRLRFSDNKAWRAASLSRRLGPCGMGLVPHRVPMPHRSDAA